MTTTLVFDTETDGLTHNNRPMDDPSQPHLVQLACLLYEDEEERAVISVIIKPEGWIIPQKAIETHGITNEIAARYGVPHIVAVGMYTNLRALTDIVVAHNKMFDQTVMAAAIKRTGRKPWHDGPSPLAYRCTMEAATPIVNLPPTARMLAAGLNKPKPPSLTETTQFLFNEPLLGAHDALVDARACARAYFRLLEMGCWKETA